jgi:hypothetical protein
MQDFLQQENGVPAFTCSRRALGLATGLFASGI